MQKFHHWRIKRRKDEEKIFLARWFFYANCLPRLWWDTVRAVGCCWHGDHFSLFLGNSAEKRARFDGAGGDDQLLLARSRSGGER